MNKLKSKKRVICAMSGGVDSSVAAALLKRAGFDVIGVFMKLDKLKSPKNEKRAKLVAKKLNISFYVQDFRKEFKERVIKPFIKECKKGKTPNPCIVCNKEIKFKLLFKQLSRFKADFIATGHYARIRDNRLLKGMDRNKDQSYFLWRLTSKLLNKILFPIGGYTKREVKQLAGTFNLSVKDSAESQEICFIKSTVNDFLKECLKEKPGGIIDTKGKVIGKHQGLWFYTIGQRKGIKLAGGPFYVMDKNLDKNFLVVTKNEKDLYKKELVAKNVNWILDKAPKLPLKAKAKIRYRHEASLVTIEGKSKTKSCKLIFNKPQRAITLGQSVVFYKGQEVLGGGIIS